VVILAIINFYRRRDYVPWSLREVLTQKPTLAARCKLVLLHYSLPQTRLRRS